MAWQFEEAQQKLETVLDMAATEGAQIISRDGQNVAALLSYEDYLKLTNPQTT